MEKMVQSISATNRKLQDLEKKLKHHSENVVYDEMAAVIQNNTLPNYFIHSLPGGSNEQYAKGVLVFLHYHRSAGTALQQCLNEIAQNFSLAPSNTMHSDARLLWLKQHRDGDINADRYDMHMGQYTFGICNNVERNCSHFTILRDPMERAISSYEYCKTAYTDEMCKISNADEMSLRQWIIHHGSLFFRQLLFLPEWCHLGEIFKSGHIDDSTFSHGRMLEVNRSHVPCWYTHKLRFENIPRDTTKYLLNYVIDNLEKWFAVIGIFDELEHSLQMFEHVYNIPFTKCKIFRNVGHEVTNIFDNRSNRKKTLPERYSDDDPNYLKYDYEVQQALAADYKIYKKAKQLFRVQRQIVLNKMN